MDARVCGAAGHVCVEGAKAKQQPETLHVHPTCSHDRGAQEKPRCIFFLVRLKEELFRARQRGSRLYSKYLEGTCRAAHASCEIISF